MSPRTESARSVALRALRRIDEDGAYANLCLNAELARTSLSERDRHFTTDLVYGTTRMRRACDYLVDRFLHRDLEPEVRTALRLGAYQLAFGGVAPHAAVSATVDLAPRRARGLVNAVLRQVSTAPVSWPSDAVRLSYPDWIVDALVADLGKADTLAALARMNEPAAATVRDDGYVQDRASQWVADLLRPRPEDRVVDLCAAPGGKATALAAGGASVVAADIRAGRARLLAGNATRLGLGNVAVVVADGTAPPLRPGSFDGALVDVPCSGLGALRRRPDARWRIDAAAVERLRLLQGRLVDAAAGLLRPGGVLVYSACTLTAAETLGVDDHLAAARPDLEAMAPPGPPWRPHGRGALLLPQAAGTDGMFALRLRRSDEG